MRKAENLKDVEFVNLNGLPVSLVPAKQKKPTSSGPGSYHRGFVVEGFSPQLVRETEEATRRAVAEWALLSSEQRQERIKEGQRQPEPWNLERWMSRTKPTRVRSKPYSVPDAAEWCKKLAEREGWIGVRVVELKKGSAHGLFA